jgi:hypothetical protein
MQENYRGGGGGRGWRGGGRGWRGGGRYLGGSYGEWDDSDWRWGSPIYVAPVVSSCPTDYTFENNFAYINNGVANSVSNVCVGPEIKDSNQVCKNGGVLVTTNVSDKTYKCMINHS